MESPTEPNANEPEEEATQELIEALDHIDARPLSPEEVQATFTLRRPGRGRDKPAITLDQRREIAESYRAGMEVDEICRAYDIGVGTLYRITRQAGLSRRQTVLLLPEEEPMAVTDKTSPTVSPDGAVSGLAQWVVTYTVTRTESVTVSARSFNDAANAVASEQPDVEVISVARARA